MCMRFRSIRFRFKIDKIAISETLCKISSLNTNTNTWRYRKTSCSKNSSRLFSVPVTCASRGFFLSFRTKKRGLLKNRGPPQVTLSMVTRVVAELRSSVVDGRRESPWYGGLRNRPERRVGVAAEETSRHFMNYDRLGWDSSGCPSYIVPHRRKQAREKERDR